MSFTTAALNAAVDAALTGATHVQLHTGAPGAAGTANVAAGVARAALSGVGGATGATDTMTASFTIAGAGGPFSHYSLWTAVSGGTFINDGTLTPAETFGGAGTLDITINVVGS